MASVVALAWFWGFIWLVIAAVAVWPLVWRWWADGESSEWPVMRWPLTIGLSLGLLTLWLLLVGFWQLNVWVALAFPGSFALWYRPDPQMLKAAPQATLVFPHQFIQSLKTFFESLRHGQPSAWIMVAGLLATLVVLGQATYYPFIGEDEINRYAYYARLLFINGQVTDQVRGYPMFMPLAYAYVFFVTGQLAEQLARLIPVILSVATVVATGALGRRWFGERGGWAAAFALLISPLYIRWSPDGYIDIPSALFFVLCAYAADVWLHKRQWRWAALAGLLAGLALWVKQAGFAALACLGVVFAWALFQAAINGRRAEVVKAVRDGLIALGVATLAGGAWYLRNAYYDGWNNAVPGPGVFYYQQARPTLEYLIPFFGYFTTFGHFASAFFLLGLAWAVLRFKRSAALLLWAVPYTLLWWQLFSYDARFLLTVLPFYALMFGGLVSEWRWPSPIGLRWGLVIVVVAATGWGIINARLGGLWQWVVAPTASYAQRLYRAKGDLYPTVEFIQGNLPATTRILSLDERLRYYLIEYPLAVSFPMTMTDVRQYDYLVVGSWWIEIYARLGSPQNEVTQAFDDPQKLEPIYVAPGHGLVVYRVVKP